MTFIFIVIYYAIYLYFLNLKRELRLRDPESENSIDEVKVTIGLICRRLLAPFAVIAVIIAAIAIIFKEYSTVILVAGTYIFSIISRRKIRKINLFDLQEEDNKDEL